MTGRALGETAFHHREGEVSVPELEGWGYFEEGEAPVWRVRQLTMAEIVRASESPTEDEKKAMAVAVLASGNLHSEETMKTAIGLMGDAVPDAVRRQIELITTASLNPVIGPENRIKVVELSVTHPNTFTKIYRLIDHLTGLGAVLGKQPRSGKTKA